MPARNFARLDDFYTPNPYSESSRSYLESSDIDVDRAMPSSGARSSASAAWVGIADPDRPPEYPEEEGAVTNLGSGVEGAANLGGADIVVWGLFGRCAERIDHQAEILGRPRLSRATVNHARDCVWRGVTAPQATALRRELAGVG